MKILIIHEKYGNRYFSIKSDQHLFKTALYILKQRLDGNWYRFPTSNSPSLIEKEISSWLEIQQAINNKDGSLAWDVLQNRSDYEYENVELIDCEEV